MAGKTNLSATLFSQKKLLGKTSTGTHRADSNEPIPSGLQVATSAVFAEDIPSSPDLTLNEVQGGTVEYVQFNLQAITGSTYDANSFDSEASSQSSGPHAYRLVLPSGYQTDSDNTKKGTYPFVNNQILHWTLGALQVVSPGFSNDVPNPYTLKLFEDDGTEIPLLDELDWQIDYFSGILFVQDYNASKIPSTAKGFIYTGKMLSQSLGEALSGGGGGGGGSGAGVGWIASANGSISTTGSVYVGTPNTANSEIFFSSVGAAVFNDQGRNSDFRVESTGKENMLFVDASHNRVGVGLNAAPATTLHVMDSNPTVRIQREANTENGTLDFAGSSGHVGASIEHEGNGNDLVMNVFNGTTVEESLRLGGYQNEANRQVILLSGSSMHVGAMQPKEAQDIAFFVSGSVDSRGTSTKGTAVFGGDVAISGTLSVNLSDAAVGSQFVVTTDGKVGIGTSNPAYKLSVGGNMEVGEYIYHKNDDHTFIRFQNDQIHMKAGNRSMIRMKEDSSDQVLILSGGAASSLNPTSFADTNFFVSGTIGSRGTSTAGTAVFGGDLVVSGALYDSSGNQITGGAGGGVSFNGGNGSDNQMITADGSGDIVAESNITFNGTQLNVSGDILPGSDNTFDLGSPSARFANIYTGDLHLRNERGHWQIVEEADALTVINRLTGKRYKMVLEPYQDDEEE